MAARPDDPIAMAVKTANNDAIIMSFPVAAFAKDGDPVIEVARMFTGDTPEFSARQRLGATGVDASRTFIEHIHTFPDNVEAEVTMTYTRTPGRRRRPAAGAAAAGWAADRCAATAPPWCCTTAW